MHNPVYSHPEWSLKDASVVYHQGTFYLFFSAFYHDAGQERCHVAAVKTRDFKDYSAPLFVLSGVDAGWLGMCSPNVSHIDGAYYLTYNSWGDKRGQPNQLFYAVSPDLENWTFDHPLAPNLTAGKRVIDAALMKHDNRYYLVWKQRQIPQIAWASALDSENWQRLGRPSGGWFENGQFLEIDGGIYLLVTGARHLPYLMKMSAETPEDWLAWSTPYRLEIPEERFNTDHRANAAFLSDWRLHDGYFYLLYAGRTEGKSHAGRGYNQLGLARSRDLVEWRVPPD